MQSLVQGLLEYSRVDSAGKKLVPVSVREVLVQALRNLKIAIEESGANVTWDELPELNADPTQIAQVFQNLIWNAIKFRSEAPPVIHVGAARRLDEWEFGVRDNGIGFDPQFADKIFQLFQRLHTRQQYAVTGIGLTICKRVIERHGGTTWSESEPGKGATFHFTLPAARQSI
ncbi:MAG: ATP-binding protein [Candidatus Hydrogenedentes bacterium]|nr:ATP-binding protein [Candidatus Hydrogenedentota bacterium]